MGDPMDIVSDPMDIDSPPRPRLTSALKRSHKTFCKEPKPAHMSFTEPWGYDDVPTEKKSVRFEGLSPLQSSPLAAYSSFASDKTPVLTGGPKASNVEDLGFSRYLKSATPSAGFSPSPYYGKSAIGVNKSPTPHSGLTRNEPYDPCHGFGRYIKPAVPKNNLILAGQYGNSSTIASSSKVTHSGFTSLPNYSNTYTGRAFSGNSQPGAGYESFNQYSSHSKSFASHSNITLNGSYKPLAGSGIKSRMSSQASSREIVPLFDTSVPWPHSSNTKAKRLSPPRKSPPRASLQSDHKPLPPRPQRTLRRIGGMVVTVYATLSAAAIGFLSVCWAYLMGVATAAAPPREILAVEIDESGKKRRAIEAPAKPASPSHEAENIPPGSFPVVDDKSEKQADQPPTPPDSRPGSSDGPAQSESSPKMGPEPSDPTTSEPPKRYIDPGDWRRADGERPVIIYIPEEPKPEPPAAIPEPASEPLPELKSYGGLTSIRGGGKRRSKLPKDAKPVPDELQKRKPSRSFSPTEAGPSRRSRSRSISPQNPHQTLGGAILKSRAPSAQMNALRDAEVDALVNKTRMVVMESPEDKALRLSWRERKAREEKERKARKALEAEQAEKQKAIEEAERKLMYQPPIVATITEEEAARYEKEFEEASKDVPYPDEESDYISPKTERAIQLAQDPHYDMKQFLVRPLTKDWEEELSKAMETKSRNHVMAKTADGTDITRHDFGSLIPQQGSGDDMSGWLNDEIVNAWMATIVDAKLEQTNYKKTAKDVPAFVAYSSQWYTNYKQKKGVQGIATWSHRKGIKGEKLLKAERIFFPVNTGAHWMLLIISPRKKRIEFLDSLNDSEGNYSQRFYGIAREWLAMELGDKYKAEEWENYPTRSSWQQNSDDCGVFACFNALASAKEYPFYTVGMGKMRDARRLMAAILLNGGLKEDFEL